MDEKNTTSSEGASPGSVSTTPWGKRLGSTLIALVVVFGFYQWGQNLLRQENPFEIKSHSIEQSADGWYLNVESFNHGPPTDVVYVELKYYAIGERRQVHIRKTMGGVKTSTSSTYRVGPLEAFNPERRSDYSVYVGATPHMYMDM